MIDAVATIALESLRDLLIEEAKFSWRLNGKVEEVRRQLETMHCFLKDADKRRDQYGSETVRDWVSQLQKLSIEADSALERYFIQVKSRREGKNLRDKLKRFICVLGECLTAHQIGNEIEEIRSGMASLTRKAESINKGAISSRDQVNGTQSSSLRRTYGIEIEEHFVGMEQDVKLLESLMKSNERSNQVISICGMGGLGKTTLANKIYQTEAVQRCFEARAWICISQRFEPKDVFRGLLEQLLPNEVGEQSEDGMVRKLKKLQREKRCLVVLDDIWEVDHWNSLKSAFPIGEDRCKVLLTSRNENVACNEYVYKLECLSEDQGWELLQKIAIPIHCSRELPAGRLMLLEDIGRKIVRRCGCLPLPISVIGGILRQEKTHIEWEKVYKNIDSYLQRGKGVEKNRNVKQVLDLSYNVLPYNLKSCFLYLGCFPEDEEIYTDRLYLYWMAEGMISLDDGGIGETLRDVAERYLCELANRCMVQVKMDETSIYNKFKSCRLHDLIRDLCLLKGKREGFLKVIDGQIERQDAASSACRLAFHQNIELENHQFHECQNLRSLLFLSTGNDNFRDWNNLVSINSRCLKSLKILILENYQFRNGELLKGIGKLILLKHLSMRGCKVDELPASVCKLPCLQSLHIQTLGCIKLPNSIHKMKSLKHLYLDHEDRIIIGGKLNLNGLNELETMMWFNSSIDDAADLINLPKLRVFGGVIHDDESLSTIVAHILNHQDQFRETTLFIKTKCNTMSLETGSASPLRKALMCHSLVHLEIESRVGKLPSYKPQLGRSLITLSFENCYIEEDPMEMLEKLPMLKYLYLNKNAFVGREMVCRADGFPQLKELYLWGLPHLVEWRVEEKTMQNLSSLHIYRCLCLDMIPEGIKFISTLRELNIRTMPKEFVDRTQVVNGQEGEDYHKIKHIPTVFIY